MIVYDRIYNKGKETLEINDIIYFLRDRNVDSYCTVNLYSIFEPYYLGENDDFTEEEAIDYIEQAFEQRIHYPEDDYLENDEDENDEDEDENDEDEDEDEERIAAIKYLKSFREDLDKRKETIEIFIKFAKLFYEAYCDNDEGGCL